MADLILPGNPLFSLTLAQAKRPDWHEVAKKEDWVSFVCDSDSGLLRPASKSELDDYLYGGEYEERLEAIGEKVEDYDLE